MPRLQLTDLRLPLAHPFATAHGTLHEKHNLLVTLEEDGLCGYGEVPPSLAYRTITAASERAVLEKERAFIERTPLMCPESFWDAMVPVLGEHRFALCALDQAAHDLWGKRAGRAVWDLWGLSLANVPESNFTISLDTPERMVERLRGMPGWPCYKIKLGRAETDMEAMRALRRETDALLRVDVNSGWTVEQALRFAPELAQLGVEFIEQPLGVDDWEGMASLYERCPLPLIADEACQSEGDVERCARVFHGINIKLTKAGGLTPARRMIQRARELGLKVMAGCMVESTVGISALAQLLPLLDAVDMDGALLLGGDVASGVKVERGKAVFPTAPGTGVVFHAQETTMG